MRPLATPPATGGWEAAALDLPHPRPLWCEIVVAEEHLSRLVPHANNAEYVRWIDRAAELHAELLGYGRAELLAGNRAWFVARHEIDYRAECWLGERLLVATWVRSMRRTTCVRETRIVRPADGRLVARASTLWAHVDLASRRPVRVDDAARSAFDPLETTAESGVGR